MLNPKLLILLVAVGLVVIGVIVLRPGIKPSKTLDQLTNPLQENKRVMPSETVKEYQDEAGFSFSYPDNLSITKNEITDDSTYSDIQISSKDVSGSLNLKITDSKFKSLDEWLSSNKEASKDKPKEVKLGNMKAAELKTADRLLLAAVDQGILFTIEMPLIEQDFWTKVYNKVLANFSFVLPGASQGSDDISFEGEEVIE